jgi:hypothetical protein
MVHGNSCFVRDVGNEPAAEISLAEMRAGGLPTSMTAPIASGWSGCRVGLAPTGKRRLCTAHTQSGRGDALEVLPDRRVVMLYDAHARARLPKKINHCELKRCFPHKLQNLSIPR